MRLHVYIVNMTSNVGTRVGNSKTYIQIFLNFFFSSWGSEWNKDDEFWADTPKEGIIGSMMMKK